MTPGRTSGGQKSIANGGCDRRHRRLAKSNQRFCTRKEFNVNFRYVSHAQHPIAIEIRIFGLSVDELGSLIEGQTQSPKSSALHLGFSAVGMNDRAAVD